MASFQHLIVGGGMTAQAAAGAIPGADPGASVGVLGDEPFPFYARPPLSKGLWTGQPRDSVWLPRVEGVDLLTGRRAVALDPGRREVRDDRGEVHRYEKLLLATGGRPRRLPFGGDHVLYFRTLADYDRLAALQGRRAVVVGGGFIGSEIAAALAQNGWEVKMIFPESFIGARVFPEDLARFVTGYYEARGVRVLAGGKVLGVAVEGERTVVRTSAAELEADAVVAGLGIAPNVELARDAGIATSDGIDVDERLRTSAPGVWAAGDVARFPSPVLGMRLRVEHENNAVTMGQVAGLSMAGQDVRYDHLPFFYSDLFDLGYEAVGLLDARLEMVADWSEPHRKGVVYYLDRKRVRGVLAWGAFGQMDAARALLAEPGPHDAASLRGRIAT